MAWEATAEVGRYEEAIGWFQKRTPILRSQLDQIHIEDRRKYFWVSGLAEMRVVEMAQKELEKAIAEGVTLEEFKRSFRQKVLSNFAPSGQRLRTIIATNAQTAYNDARYAEIMEPERLRIRPFLVYDSVMDSRTTDTCRVRDGIVKHHDDPFVAANWPPLHFNCRSAWRAITSRQSTQKGGVSVDEPGHQPAPGFGMAPSSRGGVPELPPDTDPKLASIFADKQKELEAAERAKEFATATQRDARFPPLNTDAMSSVNSADAWFAQRLGTAGARLSDDVVEEYVRSVGSQFGAAGAEDGALSILRGLAGTAKAGKDPKHLLQVLNGTATNKEAKDFMKSIGGKLDKALAGRERDFATWVVRGVYGSQQAGMRHLGIQEVHGFRFMKEAKGKRLAKDAAATGYFLHSFPDGSSWALSSEAGGTAPYALREHFGSRLRVFMHPDVYGGGGHVTALTATDAVKRFTVDQLKRTDTGRASDAARVHVLLKTKNAKLEKSGVAVSDPSTSDYKVPIKVTSRVKDDGSVINAVGDGGDRLEAAQLAGADRIEADVTVVHQQSGAWQESGVAKIDIKIPPA